MPTLTNAEIEQKLNELLDQYSIENYPAEHRNHLGASIIGDECWRKLWFSFRWVKLIEFEPRMRRLFNRGHEEEKKFIKILFWMGFFIREIDPATNKQYCFSMIDGHYGGSGDSLMLMPWDRDKNGERILAEFKTHNNNQFNKLINEGLKIAQPKHFAQMCEYGKAFNTKRAIYCAVNKDNDEIKWIVVDLDWLYAEELEKKARSIIYAQEPPPRISEQPSYFKCKYCDFNDICHDGKEVEKNCRSCKNAAPGPNASWHCKIYGEIPREFIAKGCDNHKGIINV
jgi:hypothetical protein